VLQAQIDRHADHNDSIYATTYTHFGKAMEEARDSEAHWMSGTARPLEGITCALKDEHHEAGMSVTAGSALLKDAARDYIDEVTAKLKAAGVVIHMQTTVPEFYVHGLTFSRLWGLLMAVPLQPAATAQTASAPGTALHSGRAVTTFLRGTSYAGPLLERRALTGDWGGVRTDLENRGVTLDIYHTKSITPSSSLA
jgi:hypothetical protein